MKKITVLLIVFGILFTANKTFAVFAGPISCGGKIYPYSNDSGYKQCIEDEARKAQEIKERIYKERMDEISQYSDFFKKVGVSLTLETSKEQYIGWLEQLREAKNDYIKEQEDQQKIKELEERIRDLESKPIIVEKVIAPIEEVIIPSNKEEVIKPIVNDNKIVKPVVKKEEPKKEIVEEKPSTIIETTTTTETPIIPTNKSFLKRIFGWFKSLI